MANNKVKLILKSLLVLVLFTLSQPIFANWGLNKHMFSNRAYYKIVDVARVNRVVIKDVGEHKVLSNQYHQFKFLANSKKASYKGIELLLSFPIIKQNNAWYISSIDYNTIVLPLTARSSLIKHEVKTIFIDPGHGGSDVGALGVSLQEKKLALQVSLKVATILRQAGFRVVMRRSNDKTVALEKRATLANTYNSDVFVSIHFNATTSKSVYGIETYCLTPASAASTNSSKPEFTEYNGNRFDRNNFALAYLTQKFLIEGTNDSDRGIKHARFLVLRDIKCPAILVECGFVTNRASELKFAQDAYLEKLAQGIAKAIIIYGKAVQ